MPLDMLRLDQAFLLVNSFYANAWRGHWFSAEHDVSSPASFLEIWSLIPVPSVGAIENVTDFDFIKTHLVRKPIPKRD